MLFRSGLIQPCFGGSTEATRAFENDFRHTQNDTRETEYYLRRVVDRAGRRGIYTGLDMDAILSATYTTNDALGVIREHCLELSRVARNATGRGGLLAKDYFDNVEQLNKRLEGVANKRILTGFDNLDALAVFELPSYNIIGARPSVGKTAASINLALSMAKRGIRTMFITLEVPYDKLLELMACCHNGLRKNLIHSAASQNTRQRLSETFEALHRLPIELHSNCRDINQVVSLIEDAATRPNNPVEAVFVDYVQIIRTKKRFQQTIDRLNFISEAFRVLKDEHKIAIFLAAQLNRGAVEHAPKLEDLKGTGDFEQDADAVLLLDRPNKQLAEREISEGLARTTDDDRLDVYIRKNRNGPTGRVSFTWDGSTGVVAPMEAEDALARDKARQTRENENAATAKRSWRYNKKDRKQESYSDSSMDSPDAPF